LGTQVFPFNYVNEYYFGTYDCYVPLYDYVYTVEVPCPSATPTPTPTVTPTPWNVCYNIDGGFDNRADTAVEDNEGRILFGGLFTTYSGQPFNRIVRVFSDGTVDPSFNIGTGFNNEIYGFRIQPDGKILVGGFFTSYNGTNANKIIRLNDDGTIDNTFSSGSGFGGSDSSVSAFAIQPDGKIVVVGEFTTYSGQPYNSIIRLNSDGSIDNSFNVGTGLNNIAYDIIQQSDGKKLVLGAFTTYSGQTYNRILRLNNDGTIDNSLNVGTGFNNETYSAVIEDNGKMVIVGLFTQYSGETHRQIIRLNSNGSIDNTFDSGSGFTRPGGTSYVLSVFKYTEKYYLTGDFETYNGLSANGLIQLNNNGTIDNTFNTGTGLEFSGRPENVGLLLSNGVHIVFGKFNSYNGYQVNDIAYLNPFGTLLNCPLPTPTPTVTSTPTPTNTQTPTNTSTTTQTPTTTPTNTLTPTTTPTNTPTNTQTSTTTQTPTTTRTPTPTNNRFGFAVYSGLTSDDACSQVNIPTTIYGNESLFDENTQFYNNSFGPVTINMTGFYNYEQVFVELDSEGNAGAYGICSTPTPTPTNTETPTPTVTPT
jgi:uncharacterized delta-60 repeat protein